MFRNKTSEPCLCGDPACGRCGNGISEKQNAEDCIYSYTINGEHVCNLDDFSCRLELDDDGGCGDYDNTIQCDCCESEIPDTKDHYDNYGSLCEFCYPGLPTDYNRDTLEKNSCDCCRAGRQY